MRRRLQLVWWWRPRDWTLGLDRPPLRAAIRAVYRWQFGLGPLQIRRWETRPVGEVYSELARARADLPIEAVLERPSSGLRRLFRAVGRRLRDWARKRRLRAGRRLPP